MSRLELILAALFALLLPTIPESPRFRFKLHDRGLGVLSMIVI